MHFINVFQCGTFQSLTEGKFSCSQVKENAREQMTGGDFLSGNASNWNSTNYIHQKVYKFIKLILTCYTPKNVILNYIPDDAYDSTLKVCDTMEVLNTYHIAIILPLLLKASLTWARLWVSWAENLYLK